MAKFKVTIQQHVREEKVVYVEADTFEKAWNAAKDGNEFLDGDDYRFVSIPDRWIEDVEEIKETEIDIQT